MKLEKILKNAILAVVLSSSAFISSCSCTYCPSESVSIDKKQIELSTKYRIETDYYTIEELKK